MSIQKLGKKNGIVWPACNGWNSSPCARGPNPLSLGKVQFNLENKIFLNHLLPVADAGHVYCLPVCQSEGDIDIGDMCLVLMLPPLAVLLSQPATANAQGKFGFCCRTHFVHVLPNQSHLSPRLVLSHGAGPSGARYLISRSVRGATRC